MDLDSDSSIVELSAVERWINPDTNLPIFSRFNTETIEKRTIAAAELYKAGFYTKISTAAAELKVPYARLYGRIKGRNPRTQNGGKNTLLNDAQEQVILCWAHRRITQGHHIQCRTLQHHANAILKAINKEPITSIQWAKRFLRRHKHLLHSKKSTTLEISRKSMHNRAHIEGFYQGWSRVIREYNIKQENTWNFDETGFQVGYLEKGMIIWTFNEIDQPILTDSHDTLSVTDIEAISATGKAIPPFLIIPGVQLPARWFDNSLNDDAVIATSPKGYTNDMLAIEWIEHFEKHTRPSHPSEKRLLLMDGCENHFTQEIFYFCSQHNVELFPLPPRLTHYLQPLDVGVFNVLKHWHQQVLYREVADGAGDFSKVDFLFHFQEIWNRSLKKHIIISAWRKCDLFPFDPSIILDNLKDPLSSLTAAVAKETLPGYIEAGSTPATQPSTPSQPSPFATPKTPPMRRKFNWKNVTTPPLNIRTIEQFQDYVRMRLYSSVQSGVPLTPSVTHVFDRANKATATLALNGITATEEMHRLKEKSIRRSQLQQGTSVICNYGPITVADGRLRVANDEHNRRAAQEDENRRFERKRAHDECLFLRRWLKDVRSHVRNSITAVKLRDIYSNRHTAWKPLFNWKYQDWWSKTDRRVHLSSNEWMSYRYALHRQLHECKLLHEDWISPVPWPLSYDEEVIKEALNFIKLESMNRAAGRNAMSLEVDGVEIIEDDCIVVSQDVFLVPKSEENSDIDS